MSSEKSESSVEHHILRVPLEGERFHHILVTVKTVLARYTGSGPEHQVGSIAVQATYLTGPNSRHGLIAGHISSMGGTFDTYSRSVKITNGSVMVRNGFKGLGIGSFMFDVIVKWALERDLSFKVSPIKVAEVDATEENQARRNKFYANFGVLFGAPMNEGIIGGWSDPMFVGDLKSHTGWASRLDRLDYLNGLWAIGDEIQELLLDARSHQYRVENLKDQIAHLRRSKFRITVALTIAAIVLALVILI
jgi:GNAT superfamily N-acetyltransferase